MNVILKKLYQQDWVDYKNMLKIKKTIIKDLDLKKIAKDKGMTLKMLAKVAGVNYEYLVRFNGGFITLDEKTWNKIKICL